MTAWYGGEEGGHIGFSPGRAAGRPRRERAARPAARHGRGRRPRLHRGHAAGQRAQLRAHHDGDLRHQERGAGAQRLRGLERSSSPRPATLGYGEYRAHLELHGPRGRRSTPSATTPTCASARRSRTPSTRPGSSRPASRGSGRRRCGTDGLGADARRRDRRGPPLRVVELAPARAGRRPGAARGRLLRDLRFGPALPRRPRRCSRPATIPGTSSAGGSRRSATACEGWAVGDRVTRAAVRAVRRVRGVPRGEEQVCPHAVARGVGLGTGRPGGYAEHVIVDDAHAVRAAGRGRRPCRAR